MISKIKNVRDIFVFSLTLIVCVVYYFIYPKLYSEAGLEVVLLSVTPIVIFGLFVLRYRSARSVELKKDVAKKITKYSNVLLLYVIASLGLAILAYTFGLYIVYAEHAWWGSWSNSALLCGMVCMGPITHIAYLHTYAEHYPRDSRPYRYNLTVQLESAKFSIFAMYGGLLISLILLFSQSLFFYDKTLTDKYGLFMARYQFTKSVTAPNAKILGGGNKNTTKNVGRDSYYIYFNTADSDVVKDIKLDDTSRIKVGKHIKNIVKQIIARNEEANQIVLILTGSTDGERINGSNKDYKTNSELARARVEKVKYAILSELYAFQGGGHKSNWINIEWISRLTPSTKDAMCQRDIEQPESNIRLTDCKFVKVEVKQLEGHAVEVASTFMKSSVTKLDAITKKLETANRQGLFRKSPLDFLDYVYFTTYTVGSTGYGDIVPVQPFSKFVTIIANMIEIFLLVLMLSLFMPSNYSLQEKIKRLQGEGSKVDGCDSEKIVDINEKKTING